MTRDEHLKWSKDRALEYLDQNDPQNAVGSMMSDLRKHDELADHIGIELGMMLMIGGHLSRPDQAREWIVGFN